MAKIDAEDIESISVLKDALLLFMECEPLMG